MLLTDQCCESWKFPSAMSADHAETDCPLKVASMPAFCRSAAAIVPSSA